MTNLHPRVQTTSEKQDTQVLGREAVALAHCAYEATLRSSM